MSGSSPSSGVIHDNYSSIVDGILIEMLHSSWTTKGGGVTTPAFDDNIATYFSSSYCHSIFELPYTEKIQQRKVLLVQLMPVEGVKRALCYEL